MESSGVSLKLSGKVIAGKGLEGFTKAKPWWMILQCDHNGIGRFYIDLLAREGIETCLPLAGCHVRLVRGEEPRDKALWKALGSQRFSFRYQSGLKTNGKHWWLAIDAPELLKIRSDLGLPKSLFPLHLTVAVKAEVESKSPLRPNPYVVARIELLERMKNSLHPSVWLVCSERAEYETLTERTKAYEG